MSYNTLTIIISLLAALISVVSMFTAMVMAIQSNTISSDANKIAKDALRVALFDHKKSIMPILSGNGSIPVWYLSEKPPKKADLIPMYFHLRNDSHGTCIITDLKCILPWIELKDPHGAALVFPVTLGLNNVLTLKIEGLTFPLSPEEYENAHGGNWGRGYAQELMTLINTAMSIRVDFKDSEETEYQCFLGYDQVQKRFVGANSEVRKKSRN
jgi:hypothetical protein